LHLCWPIRVLAEISQVLIASFLYDDLVHALGNAMVAKFIGVAFALDDEKWASFVLVNWH
jgi:hypothetical protein